MKLQYTEYNSLFDAISNAVANGNDLPQLSCNWRDYAIVVEDVLQELDIKYCNVGSVKANRLNNQPVYMGSDINSLPYETASIVNEFQHNTTNFRAVFKTVHANQCDYLLFAI